MNIVVKCGLVVLLAIFSMTQHVGVSFERETERAGAYLASDDEDDFQELAKLTAMNGNAVLATVAHENMNVASAFRYLTRNSFATLAEEQERVFVHHVKSVENHYLDAFALRQNKGYYVFALREILV